MVGLEAALEIRVLHRHGKSIREIARETGLSRNTVRRYLRDDEAERYRPRPLRRTKLDPFKGYVIERLRSAGAAIAKVPFYRRRIGKGRGIDLKADQLINRRGRRLADGAPKGLCKRVAG